MCFLGNRIRSIMYFKQLKGVTEVRDFKTRITRGVSVICHYVSDLCELDFSLLASKFKLPFFVNMFLGYNSLTSFPCMIIIVTA